MCKTSDILTLTTGLLSLATGAMGIGGDKAPKASTPAPAPSVSDKEIQAKTDEERRRLLMRKGKNATIQNKGGAFGLPDDGTSISKTILGGF